MEHKTLLKGKTILITGASNGIGRAVAKVLGSSGATCILLARNVKRLELVYDEILALGGPTPAIYPFNLLTAKPEDYDDLRQSLEKNFGIVDGLVNVAGITGSFTPIEQYPLKTWYEVLQTNLNSTLMLTQAILPLLKKSSDGKLIFTISKEATKSNAFWGAYAASNVALESVKNMLKSELENISNVQICSIYPNKVKTSLYTSMFPAADKSELQAPDVIAKQYLDCFVNIAIKVHE